MSDIIMDHMVHEEPEENPLLDQLTPAVAKRAIEAAKELAHRGAKQHFGAIDEVRNRLSEYATQHDMIEVTLRDASDLMGKDTMCHAVALSEMDVDGAVVEHHQDVAVVTALEWTGEGNICYRTKVKTLLDDMLYDLMPERVIGVTVV